MLRHLKSNKNKCQFVKMARLIALMRQAVNIFISNVYGKVYGNVYASFTNYNAYSLYVDACRLHVNTCRFAQYCVLND